MELIGRTSSASAALASEQPMVLVVGDSGTGKSTLLTHLQLSSEGVIAPLPVRVRRAPGSLQLALLESLGAALAIISEDTTRAERVRKLFSRASAALADATRQDLKAAVRSHFLGIVRKRVSDEAAQLLDSAANALSESVSDSLSRRITSASDQDVIDEIVVLMTEVSEIAGEQHVFLALDDLGHLVDDDLRRLADLAERLPPGIRLRGTITTRMTRDYQLVEGLIQAGATVARLEGLDETEIAAWLRWDGLPPSLAPEVRRATNGYPLHIEDAIALLKRDQSVATLRGLQPTEVTRSRARESWRELDAFEQIATAKLAVYGERLSIDRICGLLGFDQISWGVMEARLHTAGILVGTDRPWFHDLRRRAIWTDVLPEDARNAALSAASDELQTQLSSPDYASQDLLDFASVAIANKELRSGDQAIDEACLLGQDELALAAAAMEIAEGGPGDGAVLTTAIIGHAIDVFGLEGDPISAVDSLKNRGLLFIASNEHTSIAIPTFGSRAAADVIMGRAAAELGQLPRIHLASAVFDHVIRPRLGAFRLGHHGVGASNAREATKHLSEMRREQVDGRTVIHQRQPSLTFGARYGGIPLYGTFVFEQADQRDLSLDNLRDQTITFWGEELTIEGVFGMPTTAIPSRRFASALAWLEGRDHFSTHMMNNVDLAQPIPVRRRAEIILALETALSLRCSETELFAYDLARSNGWAFAQCETGYLLAQVHGCSEIFELDEEELPANLFGPYSKIELARALGLKLGQSIGRTSWRGGSAAQDPVTSTIVRLSNQAAVFNEHQEPLELVFEEEQLGNRLKKAAETRAADGLAIVNAAGGEGLSLPEPTTTYALVTLDEPSPSWIDGAHADLETATFRATEGEDGIVVGIREPQGAAGSHRPTSGIADHFGVDPSAAVSQSWGAAIDGLADLLGYRTSEVRFRYS